MEAEVRLLRREPGRSVGLGPPDPARSRTSPRRRQRTRQRAPREIEEVLYEHPAVAGAVVVGIPHAELGEEIGAAVVVMRPADPDEIRQFVRERVAAYKYPRRIWFVDALPTGPTGKVLRRQVVIPASQLY